jgi:hypothetical protein
MAAQAGWYESPGEPGMLRYWNGEAWTDHRQPKPASAPPVAVPVLEPAQLADPYGSSSQGLAAQSLAAEHPSHFQAGGVSFGLGLNVDGIRVGPGALSQVPDLTELKQGFASAMRAAQDGARSQPRSTALKGALKGMVVGIVIIVLGIALVLFFSAQNTVHPGEVATQGTVSGHSGFGSSCTPQVTFQVGDQTYDAGSGTGGSCTSNTFGDSVDVIYSAADPAHTGRYDFGNPVESFDVLLPLLGVVIFFSSLVMFFVRLVRRRSQLAGSAVAP